MCKCFYGLSPQLVHKLHGGEHSVLFIDGSPLSRIVLGTLYVLKKHFSRYRDLSILLLNWLGFSDVLQSLLK